MHTKNGFTLLEILIVIALITIVGGMSMMAMLSSSEAVQLNQTLALIQQDARSAMMTITREAEYAVKQAPVGSTLPSGVEGAEVSDDNLSFTFQVPTNDDFTEFSPLTTLTFDADTHRIIRSQAGEDQVVGSANSVTQATFELREQNSILRITLMTEAPLKSTEDRNAQFTLQSDVFLMN